MKRTVITGMFLTAALLGASPVFAAEDLCAANLQKIDNDMATTGASNPALEKGLKGDIDAAKAAQASGDKKKCTTLSTKVLDSLEKATKKGGAAGN